MKPSETAAPIIAAAMMAPAAFRTFDALRRAHFPPERNAVPAHLTLFHHLPGPRAAALIADARDAARHEAPMTARAVRPQLMGRGVCYLIEAPGLSALRERLAARWWLDLMPQDRQAFRPHITIQNKVEAAAAQALHRQLSRDFRPFSFEIQGISLWWYRGGPWEKLRDLRFSAG